MHALSLHVPTAQIILQGVATAALLYVNPGVVLNCTCNFYIVGCLMVNGSSSYINVNGCTLNILILTQN